MLARKSLPRDVYQTLDQDLAKYRVLTWVYSIRYPDPAIRVNDTVKINLETGMHNRLSSH